MIDPLTLTFTVLGTIGLVAQALHSFKLIPKVTIREGKPSAHRR